MSNIDLNSIVAKQLKRQRPKDGDEGTSPRLRC